MDAELNRKSLMLGVPGIILQLMGNLMVRDVMGGGLWLGLVLALAGTVLLIIGLSRYAQAKGHNAAWGLMGLLSIIGLIVLAVLPDRRK